MSAVLGLELDVTMPVDHMRAVRREHLSSVGTQSDLPYSIRLC